MNYQDYREATKATRFGRRKVAPNIVVIDPKPHIRKFLRESLEELGALTEGRAQITELEALLGAQAPDLIILGMSGGGIEAAVILRMLAARSFEAHILLVGIRDSLMVKAVQELGRELGLRMLPILGTPFDEDSLRNRVMLLGASMPPPNPVIDLDEALHAGWLELWYQPKIDAHTLELCGAEALTMLRHPSWGVISPGHFSANEDGSSFRLLTEEIIRKAMQDWRTFVTRRNVVISVNLPFGALADSNSIDVLLRQLPDHPAFQGLVIELDAADVIANLALVKEIARELRFSNIGISIDRLGLEWALLADGWDFPFVEFKVDQQVVAGCAGARLKQRACRQILDLAQKVGARTVAGGVEVDADFLTLRRMGVDMVQGPLFAKPATAQSFARCTLRQSVAGRASAAISSSNYPTSEPPLSPPEV